MLILNYHRVGLPLSTARYRGMYVSPKMLAWHVQLLKFREFEFLTVSDGVARGCPPKTVALTFDDGYRDNFELGLPVLTKLKVPATVYVVTGDVGKTDVIWQEAGDKVTSDLMTWDELKALESAGWEIGSHAADHVHLARRSLTEQRELISKSWEDINTHLGHPPRTFAYPYGSFNSDTLTILRELGASSAVTTKKDAVNTSGTDKLLLCRQPARGHQIHHQVQALKFLWQD